jgi:hypothetical protein
MRLRSLLIVAVGAVIGALVAGRFLRGSEERLDLYFEDGSMVSLQASSPEAQRLLPFARDLLSTVG